MKFLIIFSYLFVVAHAKSQMRLVGGYNAKPNDFPNLVIIQEFEYETNLYTNICSGAILDKYWILTAAHCIEKFDIIFPASAVVVKAGKWNISQWEPTQQVSTIASYYMHENYRKLQLRLIKPSDIGLIKLAKELQFNKWVSPLPLSIDTEDPEGEAVLAGWGAKSALNAEKHLTPDIMQVLPVDIIDRQTCTNALDEIVKSYKNFFNTSVIKDEHICTGPLTGGKSACLGDSGSPLIQNNTILGIVSLIVDPCGRKGAPTLYIKTPLYLDWINRTIMNNS